MNFVVNGKWLDEDGGGGDEKFFLAEKVLRTWEEDRKTMIKEDRRQSLAEIMEV